VPQPAAQAPAYNPIILGLAGLIMYLFNKLYSIKTKLLKEKFYFYIIAELKIYAA
jgi:hypothetical protein